MKRMWMALMLVPALAWAQPAGWKMLGQTNNYTVYVIEVVRPQGSGPIVWVALDYQTPRGSMKSARSGFEADCKRATSRTVASTAFTGNLLTGDQLASTSTPNAWEPVAPGSLAAALFSIACT